MLEGSFFGRRPRHDRAKVPVPPSRAVMSAGDLKPVRKKYQFILLYFHFSGRAAPSPSRAPPTRPLGLPVLALIIVRSFRSDVWWLRLAGVLVLSPAPLSYVRARRRSPDFRSNQMFSWPIPFRMPNDAQEYTVNR